MSLWYALGNFYSTLRLLTFLIAPFRDHRPSLKNLEQQLLLFWHLRRSVRV